ncbi:hypothetical protein JCM12298_00930 [Desulfothermus naphthae]
MFVADLHIHSKYSRATSKNLTIRKLAAWGVIKGIDVIGTGDFTHPGWMKEIEEYLYQKEDGLLYLKDSSSLEKELEIPLESKIEPKLSFILTTEISSIYKKGGKVRKIHNLVVMPSIEAAKKFNKKLAQIGNLESDGRPILGLDCEHLLEMVLETHDKAYLIPAHIWTPWFSLFGSKSGFDTISECFGSLTEEIFALETGLSSDPPMNWLWSELDRFYLVSNSDAHSGPKLGREANLFKGEISYYNIYNALKYRTGNFLGTIEFFPEEGKYHLDGHRKCGVVLDPLKSIELNNICPVCKQPLTIGVMHRIISLSDRQTPKKPPHAPDFHSLIPLPEIISEITRKGPNTKAVYNIYSSLIKEFRSEINILMHVPIEELRKFSPKLAIGIDKMRKGEVHKEPGFDGQYGRISIFLDIKEKESFKKVELPLKKNQSSLKKSKIKFNKEQLEAICTEKTPCLVIAGPGTGKTRTIIGRTIHLIKEKKVLPEKILILTFTTAASLELQNRLGNYRERSIPKISTIHSLGYELLKKELGHDPIILSETEAKILFLQGAKQGLWDRYLFERERMLPITSKELHEKYRQLKKEKGIFDYTDLVEFLLTYLKNKQKNKDLYFEHLLVDEIQDLSPIQIEAIKLLLPPDGRGFFGIGDPNQAIYSFRGGVRDIISTYKKIYPRLEILSLKENYRSKQEIIELSAPLIQFGSGTLSASNDKAEIYLYKAPTSSIEASWIAKQIKGLIGATSHIEADLGKTGQISPSEIAVLLRFKALIPPIKKTLDKMGIPCSTPEEMNFYEDPNMEKFLQLIITSLLNKSGPFKETDVSNLKELEKIAGEMNIFDPLFFTAPAYKKFKSKLKELGDINKLLNWIALQKEYDTISKKAEKVCLTTIHASKGLEFEAVFLPALEQNIIPFCKEAFSTDKSSLSDANIEEEERLLFVGITRARSKLYLSYAEKRTIFGKKITSAVSPILKKLRLDKAVMIKAKLKKRKKIVDSSLT